MIIEWGKENNDEKENKDSLSSKLLALVWYCRGSPDCGSVSVSTRNKKARLLCFHIRLKAMLVGLRWNVSSQVLLHLCKLQSSSSGTRTIFHRVSWLQVLEGKLGKWCKEMEKWTWGDLNNDVCYNSHGRFLWQGGFAQRLESWWAQPSRNLRGEHFNK